MNNSLISSIICVGKERAPLRIGYLFDINSEPMVLRSYEATLGALVNARLIDTAIAVLHLVRSEAGSQCQQLVTEANAKNWLRARLENFAQVRNGLVALCWIARTVANEEAVVFGWVQRMVPRHKVDSSTSGNEAS